MALTLKIRIPSMNYRIEFCSDNVSLYVFTAEYIEAMCAFNALQKVYLMVYVTDISTGDTIMSYENNRTMG